MIITCAECATQFQLDEARVPEAGIRVRCSVCKHAFFVAHPDALDDGSYDPVARSVHEVLGVEPGALPEPTADLETLNALAGPGAYPEEGGEENWEFSDGGRLSDPGSRDPRDRFDESFEAARDAVDDLLGSPWQAPEPPPLSLGGGAKEAPPDAAPPASEIERSAYSDEISRSRLADDPWETTPAWSDGESAAAEGPAEAVAPRAPQPLAFDAQFSLGPGLREADEEPALDAEFPDPDELEVADEGDSIEYEALGDALDGFETAEQADLDPFETELSSAAHEPDLDAFEVEPSAPDRASDSETSEAWGFDAPADREGLEQHAAPALARSEAAVTASLPIDFGPPLEREPSPGRAVAWFAQAGNFLGWSAVATLAAVALWGSVAPRPAPLRAPGSQALAGLEAIGVAGRWVENATLGSLYVVSGELHNPGAEAKGPGARLVVRLLDAQGVLVEESAASLGVPLGTLLLREGLPADLREGGEAGALELARSAVAPGARVPFEAVVRNVPDVARRFDLAAASR